MTIKTLAKIDNVNIEERAKKPKDSVTGIIGKIKFHIPLSGIIDIAKEISRIENKNFLEDPLFAWAHKQFHLTNVSSTKPTCCQTGPWQRSTPIIPC